MQQTTKKSAWMTLLLIVLGSLVPNVVFAANPGIESTTVVAPVKNPTKFTGRDGGSSIKLGDKILWMFGDTMFSPASVDGTHLRSNSAALSNFNDPYVLSEPLDANNAPYPFIPFNSSEQSYNDNASDKGRDRWMIWPNHAFNTSATSGMIFYVKLKSTPTGETGYVWSDASTGVATLTANSTTATNRIDGIFSDPEPVYKPVLMRGDTIYFTHCQNNFLEHDCSLARVAKNSVTDRDSYSYWNGSSWVSNIGDAVYDFRNLSGAVSWNEYLQKYVNIYKIGFGHTLRISTADSLEGTWTPYTEFYNHGEQISTLYAHPELYERNGRDIIISFTDSEAIQAVKITFDAASAAPIDDEDETDPGGNTSPNPTNPNNPSGIPGVPNAGIGSMRGKLLQFGIAFVAVVALLFAKYGSTKIKLS